MKLKGKTIKQFFSSSAGVLIDKEDMMVFIDFEEKKSKVIVKPRDERNEDSDKKIVFSNAFESVKVLDDEEVYDVDIVFDAIMFTHKSEDGKIDVEMAILGERY